MKLLLSILSIMLVIGCAGVSNNDLDLELIDTTVQLVKEPTAVLTWNANTEEDMHSYLVFNAETGEQVGAVPHPETSAIYNVAPFMSFYYDSVYFYLKAADQSGNVSASSDTVGTVFPKFANTLYGDVNGDGAVDIEDRAIIDKLTGTKVDSNSSLEVQKCNLDGSNKIDIDDVAIMDVNLGSKQ